MESGTVTVKEAIYVWGLANRRRRGINFFHLVVCSFLRPVCVETEETATVTVTVKAIEI